MASPQVGERGRDVLKRKPSESNLRKEDDSAKRRKSTPVEVPVQQEREKKHNIDYFYCHQCNKKRDMPLEIICTSVSGGLCRTRYCKACLKNRYGQDLDAIKSAELPDRRFTEGHTSALGYVWECPKCRNMCNCKSCRKKQGLGPTGNLGFAARRKGLSSAADMLAENPTATGIMRGVKLPDEERSNTKSKQRQHKIPKILVTENGEPQKTEANAEGSRKKAKPAVDKLKEQPEPEWEAIGSDWEYEAVVERMALRQYAVRFQGLLGMKIGQLEELDDFEFLSDNTCATLLRGMLKILSDDTQDQVITSTCNALRHSSTIPSRVWEVLEQAKTSAGKNSLLTNMPSPSEAPASLYNTRRGQSLVQSSQLLPILMYFMERSIDTEVIHKALEDGANEGKQAQREFNQEIKAVKEAWSEKKKAFMEEKATNEKDTSWSMDAWKAKLKEAERKYREKVTFLEGGYYQTKPLYAARFCPVGIDLDGRTYYVLAPVDTKRRVREEDRINFKKWSGFVSVWGKKGTVVRSSSSSESDSGTESDEEEPEEQWWGFHDIKDIRKLARWLQWRLDVRDAIDGPVGRMRGTKTSDDGEENNDNNSELVSRTPSRAPSPLSDVSVEGDDDELLSGDKEVDMGGPPSSMDMKTLVKKLEEFADWIEWRTSKKEK